LLNYWLLIDLLGTFRGSFFPWTNTVQAARYLQLYPTLIIIMIGSVIMLRVMWFMWTVARKSNSKSLKKILGMFRAPFIFASSVMFVCSYASFNEFSLDLQEDSNIETITTFITCWFTEWSNPNANGLCGKTIEIYPYFGILLMSASLMFNIQFFIMLTILNEEVAKQWFVVTGLAWLFNVDVKHRGESMYSASTRSTSSVAPSGEEEEDDKIGLEMEERKESV